MPPAPEAMLAALEALQRRELVVYPTDTLYALGGDALDAAAVRRVFEAKRRPPSMAVSVAVADMAMLQQVARLSPLARRAAERFLPGPLTLVLAPDAGLPDELRGAQEGIAVRIPDHPAALDLLAKFGPLTCTSANVHGQPGPATCPEARARLGADVAVYLDAGPSLGQASTILDLTGSEPRVLRDGALPQAELEAWLATTTSTTM
ncbi:MAG TPA: L-threonylcarbamoyladenylate synthase [Candidatus Thermoplasmatota archaeon]|jgi:tRNA threonylcarbamoyl adenosine modification protein (Sua5/YciO/YrdC/YwlC family)|nr:L-threonylcarbamoyladenylate synthase [Candidatus Thermoplasmatota archaeon]